MSGLVEIFDHYLDDASPMQAQEVMMAIETANDDDDGDELPLILDRFLSADPRYHQTDQLGSILSLILQKSNEKEFFSGRNELKENVDKLVEVMEWWTHVLKSMENPDDNLLTALDAILNELLAQISNAKKDELLPLFARMAPLAVIDKWKLSRIKGVISETLMKALSRDAAEHLGVAFQLLEDGVQEPALLQSVFRILDAAYETSSDHIHDHMDAVVDRAVHGDGSIEGCKFIQHVAKSSPRQLFGFVDEISSLLDHITTQETNNESAKHDLSGPWICGYLVESLAAVAKRSAVVVRPHANRIVAALDKYGVMERGLYLIGILGRSDLETAEKTIQALERWVKSTDFITEAILEQVNKIGRVYKDSLKKEKKTLEELCNHPKKKVSDLAAGILQFYNSTEEYDPECLLSNQEDVYGRPLRLVDSGDETVSSEEVSATTVEKITRKADHIGERAKDCAETHQIPSDSVGDVTQTANVVEFAIKEQDGQDTASSETNNKAETVSRLLVELKEQQEELRSYFAELNSSIPTPSAVEVRGDIKRRLVLRFPCSRATEPEFACETKHWAKWIRLVGGMLATGNNINCAGKDGSLESLFEVYKAIRHRYDDPKVTFETLVRVPFLNSAEQKEMVDLLREHGYYYEFDYESSNSSWHRKVLPKSLEKRIDKASEPSTGIGGAQRGQTAHTVPEMNMHMMSHMQTLDRAQPQVPVVSGGGSAVQDAAERYLSSSSKNEAQQIAFQSWNLCMQDQSQFVKALPIFLDQFLAVDIRFYHTSGLDYFFGPLQNVSWDEASPHLDKILRLMKWWAHLLKNMGTYSPDLEAALSVLCRAFQMQLYQSSDKGFWEQVLPALIALLTVPKSPDTMMPVSAVVCSSIYQHFQSAGSREASKYVPHMVMALEENPDGSQGATAPIFQVINLGYARNRRIVHDHIDAVVENTVQDAGMANVEGSKVIQQVAKRCPRLLYGFVDELVSLLDHNMHGSYILRAFADIAARNVLIVRPHLEKIITATEDIGIAEGSGLTIIGLVGRTEPASAEKAMQTLMGWIIDDVDPEAAVQLLKEVRNVAGVYKETLQSYESKLEDLCNHHETEASTIAKQILDFYRSEESYLSDVLLTSQEDIYGRVLRLVDEKVEGKAVPLQEMSTYVEQLARRADHLEEKGKKLEDEHYLLTDSVGDVKQKVNVLEVAAKEEEQRVDSRLEETDKAITRMESELQQKKKEIKSHLALVKKKLPTPSSVEAKGRIRKRLILYFQCAYGTQPDFVLETKHWTKWLRVVGSAIAVGKAIATGDAGGTLKGLYGVYKAMRRKDIDPKVTMDTLTKEPFLTSSEQDELIEALRDQGFFDEFEYDPSIAVWHRKNIPEHLKKPVERLQSDEEDSEQADAENEEGSPKSSNLDKPQETEQANQTESNVEADDNSSVLGDSDVASQDSAEEREPREANDKTESQSSSTLSESVMVLSSTPVRIPRRPPVSACAAPAQGTVETDITGSGSEAAYASPSTGSASTPAESTMGSTSQIPAESNVTTTTMDKSAIGATDSSQTGGKSKSTESDAQVTTNEGQGGEQSTSVTGTVADTVEGTTVSSSHTLGDRNSTVETAEKSATDPSDSRQTGDTAKSGALSLEIPGVIEGIMDKEGKKKMRRTPVARRNYKITSRELTYYKGKQKKGSIPLDQVESASCNDDGSISLLGSNFRDGGYRIRVEKDKQEQILQFLERSIRGRE
eukprot:gb/GECG01011988.1/.p1 GENE.gb/GECG01011988.1/~~gb/GECG01011988.1/.p1  ORF type:complete len:1716 (+),score=288.74 gb/GECG01011988.1/:1-5148(+)